MSDRRGSGGEPPEGSEGRPEDASDWLAAQFGEEAEEDTEEDAAGAGDGPVSDGEPVEAASEDDATTSLRPTAPTHDNGVPATLDEADGTADDADRSGQSQPTSPIEPRQLPSAASYFGEPRPPRHSAHVDPVPVEPAAPAEAAAPVPPAEPAAFEVPATPLSPDSPVDPAAAPPPVAEPAPGGVEFPSAPSQPDLPGEEPTELRAPTQPGQRVEPTEPDSPQNVTPITVPAPPVVRPTGASPHPQSLDLAALRSGTGDSEEPASWQLGDDIEQPTIDRERLPSHEAPGETPTADFGAVFGSTPTAQVPVIPETNRPADRGASSADPSFTEILSLPPTGSEAATPAVFDWSALPEADDSSPSETRPKAVSAAEAGSAESVSAESVSTASDSSASDSSASDSSASDSSASDSADAGNANVGTIDAGATAVRTPDGDRPGSEEAPAASSSPSEKSEPVAAEPDPDAGIAEAAAPPTTRLDEPGGLIEPVPAELTEAPAPVTPWWLPSEATVEAEPPLDPTFTEILGVVPAVDSAPVPPPPAAPQETNGASESPSFEPVAADTLSPGGAAPASVPEPVSNDGAPASADDPDDPFAVLFGESTADPVPPIASDAAAHAAVRSRDGNETREGDPQDPDGLGPDSVPDASAESGPGTNAPGTDGQADDSAWADEPARPLTPALGLPAAAALVPDVTTTDATTTDDSTIDGEAADDEAGGVPSDDPEIADADESAWADAPARPLPPALENEAPTPTQKDGAGNDVESPADEPTEILFPTSRATGGEGEEQTGAEQTNIEQTTARAGVFSPNRSAAQPETKALFQPASSPLDDVAPDGAPSTRQIEQQPGGGSGGFATWSLERRRLAFVAIGVAFVIVLVVLFFLGTLLTRGASGSAAPLITPTSATSATATPKPASTAPKATTTARATAAPTPKATAAAGPASPGTRQWSDLNGGECVAAFTNAWQQTYAVVDCGTAHPAQMVGKGALDDAAGAAYPGTAALQSRIGLLCSAPTEIDLGAAKPYPDVQVSGSFPATAEQWATGNRSYYCFISRSGGQPLTGSLAAA